MPYPGAATASSWRRLRLILTMLGAYGSITTVAAPRLNTCWAETDGNSVVASTAQKQIGNNLRVGQAKAKIAILSMKR